MADKKLTMADIVEKINNDKKVQQLIKESAEHYDGKKYSESQVKFGELIEHIFTHHTSQHLQDQKLARNIAESNSMGLVKERLAKMGHSTQELQLNFKLRRPG